MSGAEGCAEMRLLVQADLDGELGPAEAARVAAHLDTCQACTAAQDAMRVVSARVRHGAAYHRAPDRLRARLLATARATEQPAPLRQRGLRVRRLAPFGVGAALAAGLAVAVLLPRGTTLTDTVVAEHIRALQPGHLIDVASGDQHTVKPWFDGRLDFAPPVKDLAAQRFPLAGGRLDYLAGRPVAALVYRRDQHVIDLFVWPDRGQSDASPAAAVSNGYNLRSWRADGMVFWAVTDLNAAELADFVRLWHGG